MAAQVYDAVVVGSGATGGWVAKQLTEAGMSVLVLESGRTIDPLEFSEHTLPYEQPLRGRHDLRQPAILRRQIQKVCYACEPTNADWFIDDIDNPYTAPRDKPFNWIQGNVVGGRSVLWGRQTYRMSDYDFKAASRDGFGVDWPVSYADVAPYYDRVEEYIGVSGRKEGLAILPDGVFLPPMAFSCGEEILKERVAEKMNGRPITIGRCAVLTRPHRGRAACHYCGPCHRGCTTQSYWNSPSTVLQDAARTGKLELIAEALVRRVTTDGRGLADGVEYIDKASGEQRAARAKVVVLCASTLASTRILFNSANARHPNGLGNSSDVLGRYVMDHIYAVGARGALPLRNGTRPEQASRPNGIYIPRFQNLDDPASKKTTFLRGYGYQGGENVTVYEHAYTSPGFGEEWKRAVRASSRASIRLSGFGETLPRAENRVTLDPKAVDRWGLPVLRIEVAWSDNERAMIGDIVEEAVAMLEAAGCEEIERDHEPMAPGTGIHEVGTARMGLDPRSSFLNAFQQSHDVKNLFVMDGSGYPSIGCVNPTLTMMALAVRSCEYLIGEARRGNLA